MTDTKPSEREAFECHKVKQRMAGLLNRIAAALKGDPGPHRMHSWHDLPDLAAQAMQSARATQPAQQEQDRIDAERYRWLRDNREIETDLLRVTVEQAREALDDMDDYARMSIGVDAKGPREVLERFIANYERVVAELRAEVEKLQRAVPPGYALVPVEPTIAMCMAGDAARFNESDPTRTAPIYRAMLAAAPKVT